MDRTRTACLQALCFHRRRLTLFGRSMILIGCELLANAICWIVAGILFGGRKESQSILSLSLLAWVGRSSSYQRVHTIISLLL